MQLRRVAIIGGGPGGLMTAYQLQKRANLPIATTIFEAGPRLGGKILTKRFSCAAVAYEAGAAELYDYSVVGEDPLRELIAELGLSTRPMDGSTVFFNDQPLRDCHDIRDRVGESAWTALQRFDDRAKDWMSPRQFYDSDWKEGDQDPMMTASFHSVLAQIVDADARRYVQTMVHSDLATEPRQTNAAYGFQNYLMNDPAYMRLYTIDGGIERLPQELAARIDATILLNQPVVAVERADDGALRVLSNRRGEQVVHEFDFVVIALPYTWLEAIEWGGEVLAGAMLKHQAHYDYPGHYLRVSVLFQRPFWRDCVNESYFMLDAFGGCCLYDESSRNWSEERGVLGWLLGGEAAAKLSHHTDEELIALVLEALPSPLQHGRKLFVEGRVHRWTGAVNGLPAGVPAHSLEARHVPEPTLHPNLFVVGDYLFDSTLNGVLDSADFVAQWLVEKMEDEALAPHRECQRAEMR